MKLIDRLVYYTYSNTKHLIILGLIPYYELILYILYSLYSIQNKSIQKAKFFIRFLFRY
jgi:hypothetical protein